MANFDNSADIGEQMIIKFMKERMEEKSMKQNRLSDLTGISEDTLTRYFNRQTKISLPNLLKICGALELRPFFIPAEIDHTEFQRMFFN
ncbi:helix-turn-helix domain-containing protein [Chryseobacterium sp. YIM B08800]|uniref:helix-turn-helix domain-containing protein n=1 Tax=Chryseobacterium sp. YIM B08800 TaxID=2984136 RepID=UPI00223E996E|nr:helix-turn-helix transcriptional regulator [Chryseobacterium sp. YIM B08800]